MTAAQSKALEWLRANYNDLPTYVCNGETVYCTGLNTRILSGLLNAGLISGHAYLGGKVSDLRISPAWERCPCCENFWCNRHQMHAHDCDCPPIEKWEPTPY